MHEQRVVLVTGASSGSGQAMARALAQKGFTVFGTSRHPSAADPTMGVEMLALDVCADDSVRACVEAVRGKAGRLDVLINNAGYALAGAIEECSVEEARAQFETNFFGVVRMVKAVLPIMRQQGGGRIINIGSLAGLAPVPFMGFYSATKFALEGYSEALRQELKPFNIKVSLVEPGFLKTNLGRDHREAAARIESYDPWRGRAMHSIQHFLDTAPGPDIVAGRVLEIIERDAPRLRYRVGWEATWVPLLRNYSPEFMFEKGTRDHYHLDAA